MRPPLKVLILYALGQFGWSLAAFGVGGLLIYFYMPPEQGRPMFPPFLYPGAVLGAFTLIGLLSAGGRLLDAFIDPFIANWSDRKQSRFGKRRWFMLWGAVPFAVFGFLVFCPVHTGESAANFVWLALMLGLYYFFFAFYVIPYTALMAELGHTQQDRMLISTLNSVAWSLGFIIGNGAYAVQGVAVHDALEHQDYASVQAFQMAVAGLSAAGLVFLLLPAFFLDEKRYARQSASDHNLGKALRTVLANPNFRRFLLADLMYWLSLSFTQLGGIYYATVLLGLGKSSAFTFALIGYLSSFLFYWPLNVWARRWGKKRLILLAFAVFFVEFCFVAFAQNIPLPKMWLLCGAAVAVSFPLAVFGLMPSAVVGDEVEKEEQRSGQQLAGMFFGVRAFVVKVGISLANLIFPSLLLFGKSTEKPLGVQLTALAAAVFCAAGWQVYRGVQEAGGNE